jgi:hypothetical protein
VEQFASYQDLTVASSFIQLQYPKPGLRLVHAASLQENALLKQFRVSPRVYGRVTNRRADALVAHETSNQAHVMSLV